MLNGHLKEWKCEAKRAGIEFETSIYSDSISLGFNMMAFNDIDYHEFFASVFKDIKSFIPTKIFYEAIFNKYICVLKNRLADPSARATELTSFALINKYVSTDQLLTACENLTFEKFLEMKANFLKNVEMKWLI